MELQGEALLLAHMKMYHAKYSLLKIKLLEVEYQCIVLLSFCSVYTMQLMLDCKRFVERRMSPTEKKNLNYTELGREAMGPFGKWAVNLSVLACNLGVCAGYMIFISSNLKVGS